MRAGPQKLIAVLLALLVGLLPIQGAAASSVASLDSKQGRGLHHDACHAGAGPGVIDVSALPESCDHCAGISCDPGTACNAAQCVSGAPAIVSFFSSPEITADSIPSVKSKEHGNQFLRPSTHRL